MHRHHLVYRLHSGVGFINQVFSLETAIYLSTITQRHLHLIVAHPLAHCGVQDPTLPKFMSFFPATLFPYGITIYETLDAVRTAAHMPSSDRRDIAHRDIAPMVTKFPDNLSRLGVVDRECLAATDPEDPEDPEDPKDPDLARFLGGRTRYVLDVAGDWV